MDLSQIGESLIGKKVEGTVDGVKVRGTVTRVSEDEYGSTVLIQTDKPTRFFEADDDYETGGGYKSYNKIAITKGEMRNFQLVSDSNKKFQTMKRIKDGYSRGGYDYLKEKYDEYILIFNEGRNYGIYNDDAYKAAEVLGVDVDETTKSLVFPFEKLDEYLPALVRSGNKCVVVEDGFKNPVSDSRRVNDSDYYGVNAQVFIAFNDGEEETGCETCEQHNYERGDIEGHHYEIETEFDCYDGIAVANIWFDVDENTEVSTTGSNAYSETIDNMLWKMFENWGIRQIVADFQYDIDADSNEWIGDSRVKDDRFDDVTGEIQKGVDAYADVFYPYDQSNPENGEFLRNNRDRFKKHFSGRGVSVSERELSGRNGLYFERMKDSRRVKDNEDYCPYVVFEDGEFVERFYLDFDAIDFAEVLASRNGGALVEVVKCEDTGICEETIWSSDWNDERDSWGVL